MFFTNEILKDKIELSNDDYNSPSLNIAYGADREFLFGTGVSIVSILLNNRNKKIHFHIFTQQFNSKDISLFRELQEKYKTKVTIYYVNSECIKTLPSNMVWNHTIYFRLLIADFFYEKSDRVLYLDSDVLCNGDLEELIYLDISSNPVAAVIDIDKEKSIEMANIFDNKNIQNGYFNSGVILINPTLWKELNITEKTISLLKNEHFVKKSKFYDQDAINMAVNGNSLIIDKRFNYKVPLNILYKKQTIEIKDNYVFIHFVGLTKPWHDWSKFYSQIEVFNIAKNSSPWCNVQLIKPKKKIHYKYAAKHLRFNKKYIESMVCYIMYKLHCIFK